MELPSPLPKCRASGHPNSCVIRVTGEGALNVTERFIHFTLRGSTKKYLASSPAAITDRTLETEGPLVGVGSAEGDSPP